MCDGLSWKTSPGAWDVEPPVSHSGPWSTITRSVQPSRARWWTTLAPTMPAPTITALAEDGMRSGVVVAAVVSLMAN